LLKFYYIEFQCIYLLLFFVDLQLTDSIGLVFNSYSTAMGIGHYVQPSTPEKYKIQRQFFKF